MRCAIDIDPEESLSNQEVKAWGELQKLEEEPDYKESDIRDESNKLFFRAVKYAYDNAEMVLDSMVFEETLTNNQREDFMARIRGDLCLLLFSIIDEEN